VKAQADMNAHCQSNHGDYSADEYIKIILQEAAKVLCLPKQRDKRNEIFEAPEYLNLRPLVTKDHWYDFGAAKMKEEGKKGV
jgi:hypothetical protein